MQKIIIGDFDEKTQREIELLLNIGYKVVSVTAQHVAASAATSANGLSKFEVIARGKAIIILDKAWGS